MDTTRSEYKVDDARYRIGAVCRMTGLSPHVLRVWEKRYGVVEPKRLANQRRLYTETDINKLSLLKRLVDRGQAIGTLIDLDIDELERRTQQAAHVFDARSPEERPTLIGIGESLQLDQRLLYPSLAEKPLGQLELLEMIHRPAIPFACRKRVVLVNPALADPGLLAP